MAPEVLQEETISPTNQRPEVKEEQVKEDKGKKSKVPKYLKIQGQGSDPKNSNVSTLARALKGREMLKTGMISMKDNPRGDLGSFCLFKTTKG